MLLTVLVLGGTLLSAATVASLLMLYQIRQTSDFANSAKAIYAADAGIEWGLYNAFCAEANPPRFPCPIAMPAFTNGAEFDPACKDSAGESVDCFDSSVSSIKIIGKSGGSSRAFLLNL